MAVSALAYLFKKKLAKTASAEEKAALKQLLQDPRNEPEFKRLLDEAFRETGEELKMNEVAADQVLEIIFNAENKTDGSGKVVRMASRKRRNIVAAAIACILIVSSLWIMREIRQGRNTELVQNTIQHDLAPPASPKAVLTLSSGAKIFLDSAGSGSIAKEGNVNVVKMPDGQIVYKGQGKEISYHTISLPRGSRPMQLTLSDGSHIWLNAASSITYPAAFSGAKRNVTIQGEVYFEVAKNPSAPFTVQTGQTTVEVLGTHFNVNSYEDESGVSITLLEGSVKVEKTGAGKVSRMLTPGQQAIVTQSITLVDKADTEAVMAWKNGYFSLKGADLTSIMRQVSRWYDVEVSYKGEITDKRFVGIISRDVSLSDLLKSLHEFGIRGQLDNQKLTIESK
ncbi:FecR domain-containing protein [Agriterribacter humi]|jgi:ferric-dicitrate binding protein FerR (iron transport regulator)|uniref:FecR domain-containing protein n=1 Tax=Agriterribacter humi TaxID=1104781 RepID=UPI00126441BE|nr:FecR domain-containing protein [Agriterribacter humi]